MMASVLDALIREYLLSKGWRREAPRDVIDPDNFWTRDEFKGWWQNPRTKAISDRYVHLAMAIREQIEKEQEGDNYIW